MLQLVSSNTHEVIYTPFERDFVGIGFADLRFHLANEKQYSIS